jgi:hypothetical protein
MKKVRFFREFDQKGVKTGIFEIIKSYGEYREIRSKKTDWRHDFFEIIRKIATSRSSGIVRRIHLKTG